MSAFSSKKKEAFLALGTCFHLSFLQNCRICSILSRMQEIRTDNSFGQMHFITSSLSASTEVKVIPLPEHSFKVSSQEQNGASPFSFSHYFSGPTADTAGTVISWWNGVWIVGAEIPLVCTEAKWWPVIFYWLTVLTYSNQSHFTR